MDKFSMPKHAHTQVGMLLVLHLKMHALEAIAGSLGVYGAGKMRQKHPSYGLYLEQCSATFSGLNLVFNHVCPPPR
jgi:hypothetical protein